MEKTLDVVAKITKFQFLDQVQDRTIQFFFGAQRMAQILPIRKNLKTSANAYN